MYTTDRTSWRQYQPPIVGYVGESTRRYVTRNATLDPSSPASHLHTQTVVCRNTPVVFISVSFGFSAQQPAVFFKMVPKIDLKSELANYGLWDKIVGLTLVQSTTDAYSTIRSSNWVLSTGMAMMEKSVALSTSPALSMLLFVVNKCPQKGMTLAQRTLHNYLKRKAPLGFLADKTTDNILQFVPIIKAPPFGSCVLEIHVQM